ncbi:MAG: hypothetical protein VX527_12755 [Planctomycetota bacterium]|nr:hypothetical protein [Planctomycetota bacterium]
MLIRPNQLAILLAFAGLISGYAQAAPENVERLKSILPLDDSQQEKIRTYADFWVQKLNNESPKEVQEARNKLTRPFRSIAGETASRMFRSTYSKAVLPALTKIINGPSPYRAINAMQVAASIATPESLSLLDNHIEPDVEKNPQVRLWAAIGIGRCLDVESIPSDKIKTSLRALVRGAEVETDPLVLRRELETLDLAVRNQRSDSVAIRDFAIDGEINALKTTIDRVEAEQAPPTLLMAIQPGLLLIRDQYIDPKLQRMDMENENRMTEKVATYIGRRTAPQLGRIYDVILVNESTIRQNPELAKAAGQMLETSETTLKLVDSHLRNGQSAPSVASGRELWTQGNLNGLAESRDKWQVVLTTRPYQH